MSTLEQQLDQGCPHQGIPDEARNCGYKYVVGLEVAGPLAMWSRPDTGIYPVSNMIPSVTATRGLVQSILHHPTAVVDPIMIAVCNPVQTMPYRWTTKAHMGDPVLQKVYQSRIMTYEVLVDVRYKFVLGVRDSGVPFSELPKNTQDFYHQHPNNKNPAHAYADELIRAIRDGRSWRRLLLGSKQMFVTEWGPLRADTKPNPDINCDSFVIDELWSRSVQGQFQPRYRKVPIRNGVAQFVKEVG